MVQNNVDVPKDGHQCTHHKGANAGHIAVIRILEAGNRLHRLDDDVRPQQQIRNQGTTDVAAAALWICAPFRRRKAQQEDREAEHQELREAPPVPLGPLRHLVGLLRVDVHIAAVLVFPVFGAAGTAFIMPALPAAVVVFPRVAAARTEDLLPALPGALELDPARRLNGWAGLRRVRAGR